MPHIYPEDDCPFQIGKANVVREGKDLTLIACGLMVAAALDAAAMLAEEGIAAHWKYKEGRTGVAKELTGILAKAVQGERREPRETAAFADLTPREREILCHLAEGRINKAIARVLGISDGTVKLHVTALLKALSVSNRTQAVNWASNNL